MSVTINSQYVDEKYAAIIEPNLYYDSVLIPGVTYNDKPVSQAGAYYFHKLGSNAVVDPTTIGGDFSGTTTADSLIQMTVNNAFRVEEKIYGITDASVAYDKAEAEFSRIIREVSEGWQVTGLAAMVEEASDYGDTTAITDENVLEYIIGMRKAAKDNKANPTYIIVSTDVYQEILEQAGSDFVPMKNDDVFATGRAGLWYGIRVIEANGLNETAAKYYPYNDSSSATSVDLSLVDMIIGDAEAFGVINSFELMRIIDTEDFAGKKAQLEMNSGFRVLNSNKIIVKKHEETSV